MNPEPAAPAARADAVEDSLTPLRRQLTGRAAALYDHLAENYPRYLRRSVTMSEADCLDYPFRTLLRSAYLGKIKLGLCRRKWTDDHLLWLIAEHPEIILHAEDLLEKQSMKYFSHWWGGHYDWVGFIPPLVIPPVTVLLLILWPFIYYNITH